MDISYAKYYRWFLLGTIKSYHYNKNRCTVLFMCNNYIYRNIILLLLSSGACYLSINAIFAIKNLSFVKNLKYLR